MKVGTPLSLLRVYVEGAENQAELKGTERSPATDMSAGGREAAGEGEGEDAQWEVATGDVCGSGSDSPGGRAVQGKARSMTVELGEDSTCSHLGEGESRR